LVKSSVQNKFPEEQRTCGQVYAMDPKPYAWNKKGYFFIQLKKKGISVPQKFLSLCDGAMPFMFNAMSYYLLESNKKQMGMD